MFELLNRLLPPELSVFIMSMIPISELRGAIPLGIGLGMNPLKAAIISVVGNSLIVPILLSIITPLFSRFKKLDNLRGFIARYEDRAAKKIGNYRKYRLLGLYLLVAIPLPMTGAYTGCVAAVITKISFKLACITITLGVITAGIIIYVLFSWLHIFLFA